jgi:hypothetical protein
MKPAKSLQSMTEAQGRRAEQIARGANDNAPAGEACVTDAGAPLPCLSVTAEELQILTPLIEALARMALKGLSDAPLTLDRKVCR